MSKRFRCQLQQKTPEDAYCEKHREFLQLFCDDDQVPLCGKCFQSQEHKYHMVSGIREAAEKYGKLFQEILNTLKEKMEVAKSILADEQERMVMVQGEEQHLKKIIESEFRMMFRLMVEENTVNFQSLQGYTVNPHYRDASLNELTLFAKEVEKSQEVLQKLSELGRDNMNKLKESTVRLSEEIYSLQQVIAELEMCRGSAMVLLQNARYFWERSESLLTGCLESACITDMSLFQITGLSKWVKVLQSLFCSFPLLVLARTSDTMLNKYNGCITLDPNTAHHSLVLSEDLRSLRLRNVQQVISGNQGRFDFSATVLSVESFTSGRHYWEVDVEKAAEWQIGVYEDFANRKGDVPKASRDTVLLTRSVMGAQCTFWVFPPLKKVSLREQLHKIGVFLDYELGQIAFYDVTEKSLIYNFSSLTFQGALRPMFSLCIPNRGTISDCLSICLPPLPPFNVAVSPPSS